MTKKERLLKLDELTLLKLIQSQYYIRPDDPYSFVRTNSDFSAAILYSKYHINRTNEFEEQLICIVHNSLT